MDKSDIALIQSSFDAVKPISEEAGELFYGRLFEIAPEVKPLFKGDMQEQGRKLMATLAHVVNGLADLAQVLPAARARSQNVTSIMASSPINTPRLARRCSGPSSKDLGRNGRPRRQPRGPRLIRRSPVS